MVPTISSKQHARTCKMRLNKTAHRGGCNVEIPHHHHRAPLPQQVAPAQLKCLQGRQAGRGAGGGGRQVGRGKQWKELR